ncbi:MAG: 2Fe-2S iron-sulfur cluster binding domain-containing protein [Spirochaetaceae bacterium]|jgi:carbon-monoxide dehydrogenase small subunit|nr:2Fe-2S iron-sulfur cluster binding domain-containing protein [Spirochaetaceae bacterium]
MRITFILNGDDVGVESSPDRRLVDILRNEFHLTGTKAGCMGGRCGACTIIFNRAIVPACLVPVFYAQGSEIVTIEGFMQTDEYKDIQKGFREAAVENCGFCDGAKALVTESLLERKKLPERAEIISAFDSIKCRCTDARALADAVLAAAEIRTRRRYGRIN